MEDKLVRANTVYPHQTVYILQQPVASREWGGCGRAMVLGNFQWRSIPLIWKIVGLSVGSGGGCLDSFYFPCHISFFLPLSGRRLDLD